MCKKYCVNKVTSLIMVIVMLLSTIITANADTISSSQNSGKSKVVAEIAPAVFSATVPYVLPIAVDADGNVSVADNAEIQNNSNGPINVVGAEISTNNDWKIVDNSVDFKAVPVNTKQMKLKFMGSSLAPSGSVDTSLFDTISGQSSISLTYDAETAVQSEAIDGENVANALFTVEWDELFMSKATVSKSALKSFVNRAVSFQKTQENLNIDDVKADSKYVKIDDNTTDYSIYAWTDGDNNGYWWTDAITAYLPDDSSYLFYDKRSLTSIDLSGFDTSNVANMKEMFFSCSNLTSLDVSNFDTSNVINMYHMFRGCNNITSLDVSSFDTGSVTNMDYMFDGCASLTSLDVSNFDTSKVTSMNGMFRYCYSLNSLDLSSFNTSKVTSMTELFCACINLTSLNLSSFDTSNVTDMSQMFGGCKNLISLDVSNFDTNKVTDMGGMFRNCSKLTSLDLSNFDTRKVTIMDYMFSGCSRLTLLDVSNFDTSKVTIMSYMFSGCSSFTSLDLSNIAASNVTNTQGMFSGCSSLITLNLSNFKTSNVTDMFLMFSKCSNLETIYVSDFDTTSVTSSNNMFANCTSLIGGNGTRYNSSYTDKTYARIDTGDTPGYFTYKAA